MKTTKQLDHHKQKAAIYLAIAWSHADHPRIAVLYVILALLEWFHVR
jgi:hypothetical protein